jgi:hypothetical protein
MNPYSQQAPSVQGDKSSIFRAGGVAQMVEQLTSKCKALNSNHGTEKKTKRIFSI